MNIPLVPPTDNFYKFCAIGGLLCAMFVFGLPFYFYESLQDYYRKLSVENIHLHGLLREYGEHKNSLLDGVNGFARITEDKKKEIEGRIRQLEDAIASVKRGSDDIDRRLKNSERLFYFFEPPLTYIWGAVVGAFLLVSGWAFRAWYKKYQIHQDRILKAEADRVDPIRASQHRDDSMPLAQYTRWRKRRSSK